MLYLSTRNATDCYTAYRALNEPKSPDGGIFVPFRLPVFTKDDLREIQSHSSCEAIAKVLNLFFGLRLSGWDVECVVGRCPLKPESVNQHLLFAEGWRNPDGDVKYLFTSLYRRMTGKPEVANPPSGWAYIAIEIALLFGFYAAVSNLPDQGLDVAVTTGDFADITAVLFAKHMGLPLNSIICASNENNADWDLITKGEFSANTSPEYLESFLYIRLGAEGVKRYLDACNRNRVYYVEEEQLPVLNENMFAAVVSSKRVESIVSGMYRANGYAIDPHTAVAYGGLQDYRANTGLNRDTLILAKNRPEKEKG